MLSTENRRFLKERFPLLFAEIQHTQEGADRLNVQVVPSKTPYPALSVTLEGRTLSIHSKYDPVNEAERLIAQFENVETYQHIFFYGVGLGYHIEAFLRKYPGKTFTIFEPEPAIFALYMDRFSLGRLTELGMTGVVLDTDPNQTAQYLAEFIKTLNHKVLLVTLPSYSQVFASKCQFFYQLLQRLLAAKNLYIQANRLYQDKWVVNALINFKEVLQTENILCYPDVFKGRPAIIVGAGPSLNEELENLRYIKENGLACLFSAGSGIGPMLNVGIHPDFACSYDPNNVGKVVYQKMMADGITDIPLLFGSCVGPEVLQEYPGPKLHFITKQDPIAPFYLQTATGAELPRTSDGLTITFVLMALLGQLGANPIILVGQNLSFRNQQMYAQGIGYYPEKAQKRYMENIASVTVDSVDGGKVATTKEYQAMITDMEQLIRQFPETDFINTTQGGAMIRGSQFIALKTLIETRLIRKNITKGFIAARGEPYDLTYLAKQEMKMTEFLLQFLRIIADFEQIMGEMTAAAEDPLIGLGKLSRQMKNLSDNRFYQIFIKPMQATDLNFLNVALTELEKEKDQKVKAIAFSRALKLFFSKTVVEYQKIQPWYEVLHHRILKQGEYTDNTV
jgi:hypothetical protein